MLSLTGFFILIIVFLAKTKRVRNEKKTSNILDKLRIYLASTELKAACRNRPEYFTRTRALPFEKLVTFILGLVKKSLQLELNFFTRSRNDLAVSKQAFSKARMNLSPQVFTLLNDELIKEFYTDNEILTIKGFRILAVDGSYLDIPDTPELRDYFGQCHNGEKQHPQAKISILFDVLNNLTIDATILKSQSSERDLVLPHLHKLKFLDGENQTKDIILFDRGYPSRFLMFYLNHFKKDFLIRGYPNCLKEVNNVLESGITDNIVTISSGNTKDDLSKNFKKHLSHFTNDVAMQIRILTFMLPSGEREILLTSLVDGEIWPANNIFELYGMRWGIEENYKLYKVAAEVENFSGLSVIAVEQDFYATMFTCNIASIIAAEAQKEVTDLYAAKDAKYTYKINKSIAVGTIKNEILQVLLGDQNLEEYCENLKALMKRSLIPIKPGRSFKRHMRSRNGKGFRWRFV